MVDKQTLVAVQKVLTQMVGAGACKVTFYLAPNAVVRMTRPLYKGKLQKRGNLDIRLTIGKPNFSEREFVKRFANAKTKMPKNLTTFKYPPTKK